MAVICERCGCDDLKYFVLIRGVYQCRRCVQYQGSEGQIHYYDEPVSYEMSYSLTDLQKSC